MNKNCNMTIANKMTVYKMTMKKEKQDKIRKLNLHQLNQFYKIIILFEN